LGDLDLIGYLEPLGDFDPILPRPATMDLGGLNISNCKRYQAPILLDRWLSGASCM